MKSIQGAVIASAVATMIAGAAFAGSPAKTKDSSNQIRCMGVNACKGQAQCATAKHGCAGQNACKGQGWVLTSQKDCQAKGGHAYSDAKGK